MNDCVFCSIVAGTAPARLIHSDADVLAFLDIRPVRPGHTLVIPRRHIPDLAGIPSTLGARMFDTARAVGAALRASSVAADGVNVAINDGRAAAQTVFHSHIHVVPRHHGDKISMAAGLVTRRDRDPDATATAIRAAFVAPVADGER
ncbi:HIT family protein [Williamsia sp. CHRR-6]|uniref:HIT family protein n=1 Tax=Williamsia sp. CHRR-6 TaxID=2835871 RepID=UPI001BDAFF56|nr:HIT family protein [Williamsia sp. CHRR-6]MBT0568267.1 HIT family protein [Williamsia sp. CHRR-6]